jgi:6-phosphogluconolactonase/glucosamine-6-phosphate isomerase/deaminase
MLFKKFVKQYLNNNLTKKNSIVSGGPSVINPLKILNQIKQRKKVTNVYLLDERNSKNFNIQNYFLIKKILKKNWNISKLNKNFLQKKNIINFTKKLKLSKSLILMGMGSDGHFASIFSESKKFNKLISLKQKPNFIETENLGEPFCKRFTMNLSMILLSSKIIIILDKYKKRSLFLKYINSNSRKNYPICSLVNHGKNKILFLVKKKLLSIKQLVRIYG